jgi:hypothetical protein
MKIKINFVDFWDNFKKNDNYFFNLLSQKYDVIIEEEKPDFLFFSLGFGKREREKYLNHDCKKIFFTGENLRPNLYFPCDIQEGRYQVGKADFSFSFDYSKDPRNYRLPLWVLFIDWFDSPIDSDRDISYLIPLENLLNRKINKKDKFCNFIFSNNQGRRLEILNEINNYKKVDCAGRLVNNMNWNIQGRGDQKYKVDFINNYKFTIASENSKYDGYTTEKIIHPLSVGSIPIYWGSPRVKEDFNKECFINIDDFSSLSEMVEYLKNIDNDKNLYEKMIISPIFLNNKIPNFALPENVLKFFEEKILC